MDDKTIISRIRKIEKILSDRDRADTLSRYNAGEIVHKKQLVFHKCLKRNRWVFGGNRSGKTECGAVETVWRARGIHPYQENRADTFGWVVSVSYEVQRDVAQNKVLNYLNPDWIQDIIMHSGSKGSANYGIIDTIVVKNVFGGLSKIGFKSADQGREKFQGASLDYVWFDEEPPKDIYEECKMRVLDKKGDIYGTMTPLKGLTWVYEEIYLNKYNSSEVFSLQMEWADNPFLDADEVEEISKTLSESSLQSRRYGHFDANLGLVYPEFDENIHIIDPFEIPYAWQDLISIDPGLRNPLSAHFYCVDFDGNVYVVGEHYEKDKDVDYHASKIYELATLLNWHRMHNGCLEAIIDSAAGARTLSSSKSVAELFNERGILVNTKVNKELFSGINQVKSYLSQKKLFIFRTCPNLIREIKSYWWGKHDAPIKADDHAMDELRYYIMTRPRNTPPKKGKSIVEKHYERLIKTAKNNC
jgi:phage terminase large subunit-like protein